MIKALIIDDEKHCCDNLQWQLQQYCPEIEVVGVCNSAEDGLNQIALKEPQLVFLDVEMPDMSGFEMLQILTEINFDIIFTTAFDQYAIRAIKFGALDYLLKPIDKDELREAVDKHLQHALELELWTIPLYLTALYSIKEIKNQKSTQESSLYQ